MTESHLWRKLNECTNDKETSRRELREEDLN